MKRILALLTVLLPASLAALEMKRFAGSGVEKSL